VLKDAANCVIQKHVVQKQGTGMTGGRKQGRPWLGNGANSQKRMRTVKKKNKEEKRRNTKEKEGKKKEIQRRRKKRRKKIRRKGG
jgi:hypothetical protein